MSTLEDQLATALATATAKALRLSTIKVVLSKSPGTVVGMSPKPILGVTSLVNLAPALKLPAGYELSDADFKRVQSRGPMGMKMEILCAALSVSSDSASFLYYVQAETGSSVFTVRLIG